ncbi:hypothetical protein, variant 2 [Plasmodium yoelii 17X]|nr:hypothetical protein, variant 2 [Plasmodium yoelii 17X]
MLMPFKIANFVKIGIQTATLSNIQKRKMSSAIINPDNRNLLNMDVKNEYNVKTNNELKVNLNFHNNNIISNMFSNLSLYESMNNFFQINNKHYMLKYNNQLNQTDFNISYFQNINDKYVQISPWHDIDLMNSDGTYNMIVEIPKYNYIKLEIKLTEKYNVIKQDTKKGKLRYYHNSIYWNYGALPRTYEYPKHIYRCKGSDDQQIFFTGDDDPLDVIDIGSNSLKMGQIAPVKILGAFTLIDEGQLDWKIIAINKYDENYSNINNLEDIEKYYPHTLNLMIEWFRSYKMADSKKLNIISKKLYNKKDSENLIKKVHDYYLEFLKDIKQFSLSSSCESTNINNSSNATNSSECFQTSFSYQNPDNPVYNNLVQDVSIDYYKSDDTYRPNMEIWVP